MDKQSKIVTWRSKGKVRYEVDYSAVAGGTWEKFKRGRKEKKERKAMEEVEKIKISIAVTKMVKTTNPTNRRNRINIWKRTINEKMKKLGREIHWNKRNLKKGWEGRNKLFQTEYDNYKAHKKEIDKVFKKAVDDLIADEKSDKDFMNVFSTEYQNCEKLIKTHEGIKPFSDSEDFYNTCIKITNKTYQKMLLKKTTDERIGFKLKVLYKGDWDIIKGYQEEIQQMNPEELKKKIKEANDIYESKNHPDLLSVLTYYRRTLKEARARDWLESLWLLGKLKKN